MTTFWCPSDILITSWLFTARWSTWPGIHLVPCVAELVGFCILIYAYRCLPDPKCLFCPPGLSLCLSVDHFCIVPVDDMIIFHGLADLWVTLLSLALEAQVCVPAVKESTSFLCSLILRPNFLWQTRWIKRHFASGRHRYAWIGTQDPTNSATHGTRWFPGHALHRAVNSQQDMIKMSDGHRNVIR